MDTYVARQPIFDRRKKIYGYELLFRDAHAQSFAGQNGDQATSTVLGNTFLSIGAETLTGGKKMFINFTENLLLQKAPMLLPKEQTVVEILESVTPTPELIAACQEMVIIGYTLALDDFIDAPALKPLVALARIIKFDFRTTRIDAIRRFIHELPHKNGLRLLAEKIESYEEFHVAKQMGFDYFQGFFFCKPELVKGKDISTSQLNLLRIIAAVNQPSFDFKELERLIAPDIGLSYKLLRYINSAFFAKAQTIGSIQQALVYMGESEIRRFVSLIALSNLAKGKPGELIRASSVRGKLCELLGELTDTPYPAAELFTLGLFSLIDALVDQSMARIMAQLPLADPIKNALARRSGPLLGHLALVEYYERGQWSLFERVAEALNIASDKVPPIYQKACAWADTFPEWN